MTSVNDQPTAIRLPPSAFRRYRGTVDCPICGYGMREGMTECSRCRAARRRRESMARRQEHYAGALKVLRMQIEVAQEPAYLWQPRAGYLAAKQAELERLERLCGLRPDTAAP